MFVCRHKCEDSTINTKYGKDVDMPIARQPYYKNNRKLCTVCHVRVQTKMKRCECCGVQLRTKRRDRIDDDDAHMEGRY